MMRSMFSGVAGLKTHQTKMDVIGNNIANVNTTAYKSSSINFSELLYQTTSKASGPNATTGKAGINPRQIGLGVQTAAINTSITSQGAAQSTGNPFDVRIKGESFFIVNDGNTNYFTRDGSFYVDPAGNLAMTSNGFNVMGWGVDPETQTIHKDTVQALRIMNSANMTYPPEATTEAYVDGILDRNEPDAATSSGKTLTLNFYDALGYSYTAKFAIHQTDNKGEYTVELADIMDSESRSVVDVYGVNSIDDIANFGGSNTMSSTEILSLVTGAHYDPLTGIYTKEAGFEDVFSDFTSTRLSGITYSVPDGQGDIAASKAGDKIKLEGKGSMSQNDLGSIKGLIYVPKNESTYVPGGGTGDPVAYYYYKGPDPTDTSANPPDVEWKLTDNMGDNTNVENWKKVLGVNDIGSLTFTDNGVDYTLTQEFTFATDNISYKQNGKLFTTPITQEEAYGIDTSNPNKTFAFTVAENGTAQVTTTTTYKGFILKFNVDNGEFESIDGKDNVLLDFNPTAVTKGGQTVSLRSFSDINMDWSYVTWFNNGGTSTIASTAGTEEKGLGAGRKEGAMDGISIQENGEIYASYDNGMTKLLGQIAVAKFANAAGLEKAGENLYSATLNSGEFNGVGVDITADGAGGLVTGSLEMSNVDLSQEFTEMITTQRGFQANSRIITVSDTLLEELVNLKR